MRKYATKRTVTDTTQEGMIFSEKLGYTKFEDTWRIITQYIVGASFKIHEILKTLSKLGITMKIRSTLGRCEKEEKKRKSLDMCSMTKHPWQFDYSNFTNMHSNLLNLIRPRHIARPNVSD